MTRHRLPTIAFLMIALLGFAAESSAQKKKKPRPSVHASVTVYGSPQLSPDAQRRLNAFEKAWSTLNENYFDQTFGGLDWDKVRSDYQPRVSAAKTDEQVHRLITEMIGRLGRSHFAVIPPDYFDTLKVAKTTAKERERLLAAEGGVIKTPLEDPEESNEELLDDNPDARYGIGVDLRLIKDQFIVTRVEPGSSAEFAGIKQGFALEKINGVSLQDLVRRIRTDYAGVRNLERYLPVQVVNWFLNGERNTAVFLTCLDADDKFVELKVDRMPLTGEKISLGARFPDQYMQFESGSLTDDIGYIKFNVFSMPLIPRFCDALTKLKDKRAIVIDLRGNIGGVLGTLVALAGMITDVPITIGTSIYKVGSEPMVAPSMAKNYKVKIVFLVDNQTVSAAEMFSAGMQENNRALVVGQRTGGEALPSVTTSLATGAVLVFPIANFLTNNGRSLEGNGVEPNFTVDLDRRSLLSGKDPQIEKALALIEDGSAFPKAASAAVSASGIAAAPPLPLLSDLPTAVKAKETVTPPPPPPRKLESPIQTAGKDARSLQILAHFADKVGGALAFKKLGSYVATGEAVIELRGTETATSVYAVRQFPDKYGLVLSVDGVGDIREIYDGKAAFLQTDYGLEKDLGDDADAAKSELFSPIFQALDADHFNSLVYKGVIENQGRKVHVIQATTTDGNIVGMAFDLLTGLLATYVSSGMIQNVSDYRKVGKISVPFALDISGVMKVHLKSVEFNSSIDRSNFERKKFCFDKAQ